MLRAKGPPACIAPAEGLGGRPVGTGKGQRPGRLQMCHRPRADLIPDVPFVNLNLVSCQQLAVLILERNLRMVLHLLTNVLVDVAT